MTSQSSVLFVIPQGAPGMAAHHEATSCMGDMVDCSHAFLYAPLTSAICAAATRADGIRSAVLDQHGLRLSVAETLSRIRDACPDVVAVMVSEGTSQADANFLRLLERAIRQAGQQGQRRFLRLLFGPSAHLVAGPWLEAGLAECALLGEPEGAIAAAVNGIVSGDFRGAAYAGGLVQELYADDSRVTSGARGLDSLPFPAWDLVAWQQYEAPGLLSSRGCPMGCRYCGYVVAQGTAFRAQSPERTVDELDWLARGARPPWVFLRDPVFAYDRKRVISICEGILARGITIRWQCESRPEHFDQELLTLMQRAGCNCVKIGLETGAPESLVALGRVTDVGAAQAYLERTTKVASICRNLGLECRVFVMAGLPAGVREDLAATHRSLGGLPRESIIHAKRYIRHPGISLAGSGAEIGHGALEWLRQANTPRPPFWRRALRRLAKQARIQLRGGHVAVEPAMPTADAAADQAQVDLGGVRVFLTGGNGFLGGHVARALAASGAHVVALVRPGSALGALADLPCEIVRGDLTDVRSWGRELAGCVYCFHLAALYAGSDQADAMYEVNVAGVSRLLAACVETGVRRVVHTSTIGTVGQGGGEEGLPDETTDFGGWELASHYVRSKRLGEAVAESWNGTGIEVVIVKPTAPIGAGDDRPTATGARILAALRGDPFSYPPGGINHVPVRDAAMGHLLAAQRGVAGRTYILGHRQGNLGMSAFLKLASDAAGLPLRSERASIAASGPASLVANPSRAISELGLPQTDLAGAFAEAVNYFRTTGAWRSPSEAVNGRHP